MKVFIWLTALALVLMCFLLWAFAHIETKSLSDVRGLDPGEYYPYPNLTQAFIIHEGWLILYPLPWVVGSIALSRGKEISYQTGFVFMGTVFLGVLVVLIPFLVAAALPWLPMKVGLVPR